MSRCLLIGGAGFIGHNLAIALRQRGHLVAIADSLTHNNLPQVLAAGGPFEALYTSFIIKRFHLLRDHNIDLFNVDARDSTRLSTIFTTWEPEKIIHLSAISSAVEARRSPGLCFDLQLTTLRNALELCAASHPPQVELLFLSSSTVYGDFETPTVDETIRPSPRGMYANAKYMGERFCRTYSDQYGIPTTIIRPSALYGERCVSERVSQAFINRCLLGEPLPLEGGGEGRLDFTYIKDLVHGIALALELPKRPHYTNTFNITYGNSRSINDLVSILRQFFPDLKTVERERSVDKPIRGTLSMERAKTELGFVPAWNLESGYVDYVEDYISSWRACQ